MHWFGKTILLSMALWFGGCIEATNETIDQEPSPVKECVPMEGVLDGADFVPKSAVIEHESDGRTHPDIFYMAWGTLNSRTNMRFPASGFSNSAIEDKLLVSRKQQDGSYKTWQLYPPLDNECQDVEKVRIHSFDVAPDGRSLYVSLSKPVFDPKDTLKEHDLNPDKNLGIFKLDIASKKLTPVTHDYSVSYTYPTYIGDDNGTGHEMLIVAKTVKLKEIELNYKLEDATLLDEYERTPTPLIHKLDTVTGAAVRIGMNNSHQMEPTVINSENNVSFVVYSQWEHHGEMDRFSLWKMQIDGSDNFTYYGEESITTDTGKNIFQPREIKSGKYKGYLLFVEGSWPNDAGEFTSEGSIVMTHRKNLDLRSDKIYLTQRRDYQHRIARTPEHYNNESFVYSYRNDSTSTAGIYIKDYPQEPNDPMSDDLGESVLTNESYHFIQPRSFYPPEGKKVAPGLNTLSEDQVSFTNTRLNSKSGYLVQTLGDSDNGAQHQLDGINTNDIRLQFFIPSHTFQGSYSMGHSNTLETDIPASDFLAPEADGSLGAILKTGLYTWKVHKRFALTDGEGREGDLWIPIRAERQEVNFVANRVNACNECHQERSQEKMEQFRDYQSIAQEKMQGDLTDMIGTDRDISEVNVTKKLPDFHQKIMPLLTKPSLNGGKACVDCHHAGDSLNLANTSGISAVNPTYQNLTMGVHKIPDSESTVPYLYPYINPMGTDGDFHAAPFMWSLLLNDDLTVPPDANHTNSTYKDRNLDRKGDYGAYYSEAVLEEIHRINALYDHSKHWSLADMQSFITYGTTRIPVGLSDRIDFKTTVRSINSPQAQKAYQAMVRNCYECHNDHSGDAGIYGAEMLPKQKRYRHTNVDRTLRFIIHKYKKEKDDTIFSPSWEASIAGSMWHTLTYGIHRVDFNDTKNAELLVYARGYYIEKDGTHTPLHDNIKPHSDILTEEDSDYIAIKNWIEDIPMSNQLPKVRQPLEEVVLKEYDEPRYIDIEWYDPDSSDDKKELSQLFVKSTQYGYYPFNNSILGTENKTLESAILKVYAMLGDRGERQYAFSVVDGLDSASFQTFPVRVESNYNVPRPSSQLPNSYLFFTDRATGTLRKIERDGTEVTVGVIEGYNENWTTVYRRADRGWLYFLNQTEQKIYVVNETTAEVLFDIEIDHSRFGDGTVYLIWWRPAEGIEGDSDYRPGELQGILESNQPEEKKGDFYVGLGSGESSEPVVTADWRTKLEDGGNTIGIYVWRRATFMSKWVNGGTDRLNALNLVTGGAKSLTPFTFESKTLDGINYTAHSYDHVRAIAIAEDGAFYGFDKSDEGALTVFNFDPLEKVQTSVTIPDWYQYYIDHYQEYATPFLVIEKRE